MLNLHCLSILGENVCPASTQFPEGSNLGYENADLPSLVPFCLAIGILTKRFTKPDDDLASRENLDRPMRACAHRGRAHNIQAAKEATRKQCQALSRCTMLTKATLSSVCAGQTFLLGPVTLLLVEKSLVPLPCNLYPCNGIPPRGEGRADDKGAWYMWQQEAVRVAVEYMWQ